MNIFVICPVRNATDEQKDKLDQYIKDLEKVGHTVYYPARDTDQVDDVGFRICEDNARAIAKSDEVHIFWDKNSKGSLFDLGVAFAFQKTLVIANVDEIEPNTGKSFENMICYWSMKTDEF